MSVFLCLPLALILAFYVSVSIRSYSVSLSLSAFDCRYLSLPVSVCRSTLSVSHFYFHFYVLDFPWCSLYLIVFFFFSLLLWHFISSASFMHHIFYRRSNWCVCSFPSSRNLLLTYTFFQIVFLVLTLATFGFGVYGVTQIETDYDSIWYMDQGSYQTDFFDKMNKYFPENGERVEVYIGNMIQFCITD